MKLQFIREHDRRRKSNKRFLFFVSVVLTVITLRFASYAISPDPGQPAWEPSREWGALILLALPWAAFAVLARNLARHDRDHGNPGDALPDRIRALLDENRGSRTRLKIVAALHGVILVVLPVVVYQLRAVGKAGDEIIIPAFVIWPLIAGAILLAMRWHYRTRLVPRQKELENLLQSYNQA